MSKHHYTGQYTRSGISLVGLYLCYYLYVAQLHIVVVKVSAVIELGESAWPIMMESERNSKIKKNDQNKNFKKKASL